MENEISTGVSEANLRFLRRKVVKFRISFRYTYGCIKLPKFFGSKRFVIRCSRGPLEKNTSKSGLIYFPNEFIGEIVALEIPSELLSAYALNLLSEKGE